MSKTAHDQYIDADEEEETCPLCIEDFDLTDKGFRPCPCGYQICQFCYNSIKNNMNGLCPACRRQYDDKQIEYKVITPEETAAYKARQAQKQKKTQAALQKERQKAEADSLSRKHLAGLRVVQKNLVYVTGIAPKMQEDELLQTLRGDKYFGQYGKIIKIVVSKARDKHDSVGVYVTYERKEDAAGCIAAVDGNVNGDRTLRAQFGTTKYCSAYLRGDTCMNRNCMFLHEPGEAKDSYSRADLSALNAGSSQQGDSRPPPPQSQQPVSAASQPMGRQLSDPPSSPSLTERPALPSTASWASRPIQATRAESRSTSGTVDSPAVTKVVLAPVESAKPAAAPVAQPRQTKPSSLLSFRGFISRFVEDDLCFTFDGDGLSEQDLEIINNYPALFDLKGGARIRARRQRDEEAHRVVQETQLLHQTADFDVDEDDAEIRGSMHLGGEPEDRHSSQATQVNDGSLDQRFAFGDSTNLPAGRALTPHQQMLLQSAKSGGTPLTSAAKLSNAQQTAPGHQRNASRFSFANDTASASATVKPVANQKLLAQQSTMMPPASAHFTSPQQGSGFFTSNVQGPPPGLKSSGTPPVSGGMTFAQGHGFTTGGLPYGSSGTAVRNSNDEMMSNLLRTRGVDATAKHDEDFPPLGPARQTSISSLPPGLQAESTRRSTPTLPPGLEDAISSRRGTPSIPLGLNKATLEDGKSPSSTSKPTALPDLEGTLSRPSSRQSMRRVLSNQIIPAVPLRVATPVKQSSRPSTPSQSIAEHTKLTRTADVVLENKSSAEHAVLAPARSASVSEVRSSTKIEQASDVSEISNLDGGNVVASKGAPNQHKRKHPGRLDISAAVPSDIAQDAASITPARVAAAVPVNATSSPPSPSTPVVASPANKPGPRTLRVVQTPKTETPPPITTALPPTLATALATATRRLPSRQPSIASMNMPGTPSSEQVSVSDNVSITSTSQSRANSPPPISRVGSAPVRTKTKSQIKKERQERAKALDEVKVDDNKPSAVEDIAQEAIIGRKKKTKKEKEVKPKARQSKADETILAETGASRPVSPVASIREATPAIEEAPTTPPPVKAAPVEPSPPPTPTVTTQQFIAELKAADATVLKSLDALFRVPVINAKVVPPIAPDDLQDPASWQMPDYNIKLTREEVHSLLHGGPEAVAWDRGDGRLWSRTLITPGGAQLRALTEEQERRYTDLEKHVMDLPEELQFRPTKPQNETSFPTFDLKALKKSFDANGARGVSVMEQMVQDGNSLKKGAFLVDEASKYINEFVMPPVTPPQSAGRGAADAGQQQSFGGHFNGVGNPHPEQPSQSLEILERQLQEAKRAVDEREGALRRTIRKNKKLLGLG